VTRPAAPGPGDAVRLLKDRFALEATADGALVTVPVERERWQAVAAFAKEDLGCRFFNWLSAVDWKDAGREVLCRVENLDTGLALMLRTKLPVGDERCPTLTGLWRGADWMERECYDMFGVRFDGHPDLRRILLAEDWEGYPLLKDYAVDTPHPPYR
jgi:NADH-quinone oxidoreductase subunit C